MTIIDQIREDLARAEALTRDEERSGIVHGANWRTAQRLRAELELLETAKDMVVHRLETIPVTTEPSLEEPHIEFIPENEPDKDQ